MRASFYVVVCSDYSGGAAMMQAEAKAEKWPTEVGHLRGSMVQIPGLRSGQRPMISAGRSPLSCSSTTSNPHS